MIKQNYLEVFINVGGDVTIKTGVDDFIDTICISKDDIETVISGLKMCQEELEAQDED